MNFRQKLTVMLTMQSALNSRIHPRWYAQGYCWTDAIMVEAVEALEHYGWKWWKKQEPDLAQVKIELVDIWHFALSIHLERSSNDIDTTVNSLMNHIDQWARSADESADIREGLRGIACSAALQRGYFDGPSFVNVMSNAGLSWDELYTTYVAKNVLNSFRQDHGYRDGTYLKVWDGKEDNVVLERLMSVHPDATPEGLYSLLADMYDEVTQPC